MGQFHGFYRRPPMRKQSVKPATHEERLESMQKELDRRLEIFGPDHPMVQLQRESIARMEELPSE